MTQGNGEITIEETRTALLNGYIRRTKIITTEQGVSIELREPTVAQRGRMLRAGGLTGANANITEIAAMQVAAVIECCYHPGSGKKLFDHTDIEVIESLPTASWFDTVATAAMSLMNDEAEEAGKVLSETPSDLTSSSSPANSGEQSVS
jgi:hypothetical protein